MTERRMKRSSERNEALQYLMETLADRSGVRALVLVDEAGRIVAGTGMPTDVLCLALTARDVAWRRATPADIDALTRGCDVSARTVSTRDGSVYMAALGDGIPNVGDAARAVQRIVLESLN